MTQLYIYIDTKDSNGDDIAGTKYPLTATLLESSQTFKDDDGSEKLARRLFYSVGPVEYNEYANQIEGDTCSFEYDGTVFNVKSLSKQRDFDGELRGVRLELVEE